MQQLLSTLARYGMPFVFANVLVEQLGLPIPAIPTLIVAGALAANGSLAAPHVLAVALLASLTADSVWYFLGRNHGYRILKTICRMSLSPDSCVRQTESLFDRLGMPSLLVAKFIPGFSTVAPPIAGAMRTNFLTFLLYDAGGALIWAGAGVGVGMIFHHAISRVETVLSSLGTSALVLLGAALALFIGAKWWQRRRFYQTLRLARISTEDLRRMMDEGKNPVILDVRTAGARNFDPRRIPGAVALEISEIEQKLSEVPADREIILYCT